MIKWLYGFSLLLAASLSPSLGHAVEKTAVDRRANTPIDVQLDTIRAFVSTLQTRIEQDLGERLTRLTTDMNTYNDLVPQLENRIELLANIRNTTACAHAQLPVPATTSCDPTRNRLRWTGAAWTCAPRESWEQ